MAEIGSVSDYTPFAAQSPSSMTWDETFLYGPEANFMLQRHALASDTDTWEHRNEPFPYSVLPTTIEAGLASLVGGLAPAQILSTFIFPTITAWLLIGIFRQAGASALVSAALALLVLAVGFSTRTVPINIIDLLRHGLHGGAIDTMQAARNPNPNMSFPLFLGAMLCLSSGVRHRSTGSLLMAGLLGGLEFYTYTYYAIGWTAAVVFLCLLALIRPPALTSKVAFTLAATAALAAPFFWWSHLSKLYGGYQNRANRLGMLSGHMPSKAGILLTIGWGAAALIAWLLWNRIKPRHGAEASTSATLLVLLFCILGGLAGMNMQIVTGFNVQETHHFPHMILQPLFVIMVCIVIASLLREAGFRLGIAGLAMVYIACAAAQIEAAASTASVHRIPATDRSLFAWLNANTEAGAVVATTDLRLATILPLYTHDGTLMANGSRTSASNEELIERYLLANKLIQAPAATVRSELSQGVGSGSPLPLMTYSEFLFETAPQKDPIRWNLTPDAIEQVMREYQHLDPAAELQHLRVDYVWLSGGSPSKLSDFTWNMVFEDSAGSLWQIGTKSRIPHPSTPLN
jgi:hypothetical protein